MHYMVHVMQVAQICHKTWKGGKTQPKFCLLWGQCERLRGTPVTSTSHGHHCTVALAGLKKKWLLILLEPSRVIIASNLFEGLGL